MSARSHVALNALLGPERPEVTCYCGRSMELRSTSVGKLWSCTGVPECDGLVGAHRGSHAPLGTPTNKAGREARQRAHAAFDPLWQSREMERGEAYEWLKARIGKAHIAEMDVDECERVVRACLERKFRGKRRQR